MKAEKYLVFVIGAKGSGKTSSIELIKQKLNADGKLYDMDDALDNNKEYVAKVNTIRDELKHTKFTLSNYRTPENFDIICKISLRVDELQNIEMKGKGLLYKLNETVLDWISNDELLIMISGISYKTILDDLCSPEKLKNDPKKKYIYEAKRCNYRVIICYIHTSYPETEKRVISRFLTGIPRLPNLYKLRSEYDYITSSTLQILTLPCVSDIIIINGTGINMVKRFSSV